MGVLEPASVYFFCFFYFFFSRHTNQEIEFSKERTATKRARRKSRIKEKEVRNKEDGAR